MNDLQLVEALKAGNLQLALELIESGANVNQQDEQGWAPLHWAAGKGYVEAVRLLLEKGADVFKVGRDQRTAYKVALAASNVEVAKLLAMAEEKADPEKARRLKPKYCRAYHLSELRAFPRWNESRINWKQNDSVDLGGERDELSDDAIVFVHEDFVVTKSMWRDENIIYNQVDHEWEAFCKEVLGFNAPDYIDLVGSAKSTAS